MESTTADFQVGDTVVHVFHGRHFTVVKVGRKYVHCTLNLIRTSKVYQFLPSSLVKR